MSLQQTSSLRTAHGFYASAFHQNHAGRASRQGGVVNSLMRSLVRALTPGESSAPPRPGLLGRLGRAAGRLLWPFGRKQRDGARMLCDLFLSAFRKQLPLFPVIANAMRDGDPPLAEHEQMFSLICGIDREVAGGIAKAVGDLLAQDYPAGVFDLFGAVAAEQFILLPYYFALFHQNRERAVLGRITGITRRASSSTLRVAVFSDNFSLSNSMSRLLAQLGQEAHDRRLNLTVLTSDPNPSVQAPYRRNFQPLVSQSMSGRADASVVLPPLLEVLAFADQEQFDVVCVDSLGGMGLCGYAAARMLQVPLIGLYHDDFATAARQLLSDRRMSAVTDSCTGWLCRTMNTIMLASREHEVDMLNLGVTAARVVVVPSAARRDSQLHINRFASDPAFDAFWDESLQSCHRFSAEIEREQPASPAPARGQPASTRPEYTLHG